MLIQEFEIERKNLATFYIEYLRTHKFIKNKSVILAFLKKTFPDVYFGNDILNFLKYKISYFCKLALETDVIYSKSSYSKRTYLIKNKKNIPKLEEKLNCLKNFTIKITI